MSTRFPSGQEIARKWYVVDASGQTLGRLATHVARILSGKNNPKYTPFLDLGDHVIVINADKIRVTGMKTEQKVYRKRLGRRPEQVVQDAILGMLPKTKLGRSMGKKLKVYKGDVHRHQAQKPEQLVISS